jgi:hypothetical protein
MAIFLSLSLSLRIVSDWDLFEQLLTHSFTSLHSNANEHPILISEPAFNTKAQRQKLCELVFEKFNPPAFFVVKTPVLTAFASGRTNATVVDCGASHISVSAVHEGFSLTKCKFYTSKTMMNNIQRNYCVWCVIVWYYSIATLSIGRRCLGFTFVAPTQRAWTHCKASLCNFTSCCQ